MRLAPAAPPLSWMASLRWPVVERVLATESPESSVVELGCGQGAVGARLARRFAQYTGVEPDELSRSVAAERVAPLGGRVVAALTDLMPGQAAHVLCAFEVMEHIEDDREALRHLVERAGRPGSLVILSVPADPHRYSATDELVGHYRRYTDGQLVDLLRAAGLTQIHHRRYGFPLAYALEDVRDVIARRRLRRAGADRLEMETRSHGSGRLLQPSRSWETPARRALTAPFLALQDLAPQRGPCLLGWARV